MLVLTELYDDIFEVARNAGQGPLSDVGELFESIEDTQVQLELIHEQHEAVRAGLSWQASKAMCHALELYHDALGTLKAAIFNHNPEGFMAAVREAGEAAQALARAETLALETPNWCVMAC